MEERVVCTAYIHTNYAAYLLTLLEQFFFFF